MYEEVAKLEAKLKGQNSHYDWKKSFKKILRKKKYFLQHFPKVFGNLLVYKK